MTDCECGYCGNVLAMKEVIVLRCKKPMTDYAKENLRADVVKQIGDTWKILVLPEEIDAYTLTVSEASA